MPDFAASLISGTTVTIVTDTDNTIITVTDSSNYAASTESGHLQAAFDEYRKIIFTLMDGSLYTFSSIAGFDATLTTGDTNGTAVYTVTEGGGVYQVRLLTVPTWGTGFTYEANDCVYNTVDKKLYKANVTNNAKPPELNSTEWTVVTEANLPLKYNVQNAKALKAAWNVCIKDKGQDAFCKANAQCFDDELLTVETVDLRLTMARDVVDNFMASSDFDNATVVAKLLNEWCEC